MRLILALLVALVGLAQPAFAVCIIRGGAVSCIPDSKFPGYYDKSGQPIETGGTPRETTVMQPSTTTGAAWLPTPVSTGGASVVSPAKAVAACGSDASC